MFGYHVYYTALRCTYWLIVAFCAWIFCIMRAGFQHSQFHISYHAIYLTQTEILWLKLSQFIYLVRGRLISNIMYSQGLLQNTHF